MKRNSLKLGFIAFACYSTTALSATLYDGTEISADNTGSNYDRPSDPIDDLPYLTKNSDSTLTLTSPIDGSSTTINYFTTYLAESVTSDYNDNINNYSDASIITLYRGNTLTAENGATATFTLAENDSDPSKANILYFYQNYADNATVTNYNGTVIFHSNAANGATLTNSASGTGEMYIINNAVNNATLQNNSVNGTMIIKENNASNATINNSGYMELDNNTVTGTEIINEEGGQLIADTNKANSATIINHGTMSFSNSEADDATLTNSGDMTLNNNTVIGTEITNEERGQLTADNNKANNATLINHGTMSFSNSEAANSIMTNSGTFTLTNNTVTNTNITNDSSGSLVLTENYANGATINNNGLMNFTDNTTSNIDVINNGTFILKNNTISDANITNQNIMYITDNITIGGISSLNNTSSGTVYLYSENNDQAISLTFNGDVINNGTIYLSDQSKTALGNTLNINGNLNGSGTYYLQTIVSEGVGDSINITGAVNGSNTLYITDTGTDPLNNQSLQIITAGKTGTGDFTLNGNTVDVGTYRYILQKDDNTWSLVNASNSKQSLSAGANAAVGMRSAVTNLWDLELGSLINRLGDIRLNHNQGGLWIKDNYKRIHGTPNSSRNYTQKYNGIQLGYDRPFKMNGGTFYLGGFVGFSHSSLDFKENNSTGAITSRSFGVYGTSVLDNGFYVDSLIKFSRMDTKNSYSNNIGERISSEENTVNSLGASVEVGKRFDIIDNWFVQPEIQLSLYHVDGNDYQLSNNMIISNGAVNIFNGRVGVTVGTNFVFDNANIEPYFALSHTQNIAGKNHIYINSNNLSADNLSTRQQYSLGTNINVYKNNNIYFNASYEHGSKIEQPFGINVGYRYTF